MEALEPFRCPVKTKQDPAPLDHLKWSTEKNATFDIKLQVQLLREYIGLITYSCSFIVLQETQRP